MTATSHGHAPWYAGQRPITLAVLALGGEGGGVLSDWIVGVAEHAGYRAQSTSVAGVAQRTGATVYYVELHPPGPAPAGGRAEPVLAVFPAPGEVDVVVASELMEAGRAVQRGFCTPDRTTLIASTNRVYSVDEKSVPGDGRVDTGALLDLVRARARRVVAADFAEIAARSRSLISAALLGAVAGAAVLPFPREAFEDGIRRSGTGVGASLAAFDEGFAAAAPRPAAPRTGTPVDISIGLRPVSAEERKARAERDRNAVAAIDPAALVGPALRGLAERVRELPEQARSAVFHGLVRTAVHQDLRYAEQYLDRVARLAALDPEAGGAAALTVETARQVALWMCYQDTIHVAQQKVRVARMRRVRAEAGAGADEVVRVREFLHPRVDEITDTLPAGLGARLRDSRWFPRVFGAVTDRGMILNTSSATGFTLLATMARCRPLRRRSLRFGREQAAIERWLAAAERVAGVDPDLAREIVRCQAVLKGYGATWERGTGIFAALMTAADDLLGTAGAAARLAELHDAALADEDGTALRAALA